ncbi:50S ribosomal protein L4 [Striga asiatica]|uniref:50S ribosomal protein L4 n=1 Tax=Striga asiatica TaxID=4170 RepID=A0A5A7R0K6_STRAF|nr:50S ribosomal protein L4 [Striga asiatica]
MLLLSFVVLGGDDVVLGRAGGGVGGLIGTLAGENLAVSRRRRRGSGRADGGGGGLTETPSGGDFVVRIASCDRRLLIVAVVDGVVLSRLAAGEGGLTVVPAIEDRLFMIIQFDGVMTVD